MADKNWWNPLRSLRAMQAEADKTNKRLTFAQRLEGVYRSVTGRLNEPKQPGEVTNINGIVAHKPTTPSRNHMGIYDAITLGIPNTLESFARGNWTTRPGLRLFVKIVLSPVWIPLNLVRATFGAIVTLFALIPTALAHRSANKKADAADLQVAKDTIRNNQAARDAEARQAAANAAAEKAEALKAEQARRDTAAKRSLPPVAAPKPEQPAAPKPEQPAATEADASSSSPPTSQGSTPRMEAAEEAPVLAKSTSKQIFQQLGKEAKEVFAKKQRQPLAEIITVDKTKGEAEPALDTLLNNGNNQHAYWKRTETADKIELKLVPGPAKRADRYTSITTAIPAGLSQDQADDIAKKMVADTVSYGKKLPKNLGSTTVTDINEHDAVATFNQAGRPSKFFGRKSASTAAAAPAKTVSAIIPRSL